MEVHTCYNSQKVTAASVETYKQNKHTYPLVTLWEKKEMPSDDQPVPIDENMFSHFIFLTQALQFGSSTVRSNLIVLQICLWDYTNGKLLSQMASFV